MTVLRLIQFALLPSISTDTTAEMRIPATSTAKVNLAIAIAVVREAVLHTTADRQGTCVTKERA